MALPPSPLPRNNYDAVEVDEDTNLDRLRILPALSGMKLSVPGGGGDPTFFNLLPMSFLFVTTA